MEPPSQWGALLPKISASPKGLVICQGISDSPTQKNLSFMKGSEKCKVPTGKTIEEER